MENSKKINRSYKIINKKDAINYDKIWFVCFNNIRADRGNSLSLSDEKKCNYNLENFKIVQKIEIPDFKIILFSK